MTTEKLYYNDSYIKIFEATVLSCEKNEKNYEIILDKTAFFPEGGGQKADVGKIGDVKIFDVQEINGNIFHYSNEALTVGEKYTCSIDWNLRFLRMQEHSGEHIVSGIVHRTFGYDNVGFHMEKDYVTVDFNGELTRDELDDIEKMANFAVYNNYKINCFFPSKEELKTLDYRSKLDLTENVRLVEIENTDLCACCAPHVNRTGEIGIIKILDFMRHRGGVRIFIKSGYDALCEFDNMYRSVFTISNLLSAKQGEISDSVERLLVELDTARKSFYDFKMLVSNNQKLQLNVEGDISYCIVNGFDGDMLRNVVNYGMEKTKLSLAFSGDDENGYTYVAGSLSLDVIEIIKKINSALNGKGGGRGNMVQGKIAATRTEITDFIISNNKLGVE